MKYCTDCGEEINPKRLKIHPNTKICVYCQEEKEAKGQFARHRMEIEPATNGWAFEEIETTFIRGDEV